MCTHQTLPLAPGRTSVSEEGTWGGCATRCILHSEPALSLRRGVGVSLFLPLSAGTWHKALYSHMRNQAGKLGRENQGGIFSYNLHIVIPPSFLSSQYAHFPIRHLSSGLGRQRHCDSRMKAPECLTETKPHSHSTLFVYSIGTPPPTFYWGHVNDILPFFRSRYKILYICKLILALSPHHYLFLGAT